MQRYPKNHGRIRPRKVHVATMDKLSGKLVDSPLIVSVSLHRHRPRKLHPYFLPFIILYPLWYYIYNYQYERFLGSEEWTFITIVTLVSTQSLLWLSGHWSVNARALTRYTKVTIALYFLSGSDNRGKERTPRRRGYQSHACSKPRISRIL